LLQKSEFREGLAAFGLSVEAAVVDQLFDEWDFDRSGDISLVELHRILRHGGVIRLPSSLRHDTITQREVLGVELDELIEADELPAQRRDWRHLRATASLIGRLQLVAAKDRRPQRPVSEMERTKLLRELQVPEVADDILATLSDWDAEFKLDGAISKRDFRRVLPLLPHAIKAERHIVDSLFDEWDPDCLGKLDLHLLDSKLNEHRKGHTGRASALKGLGGSALFQDGDKSVAEQLRDALVANSMRVIDLFREWDEDGDGNVDRHEFRRAMPLLGLHAAREHIDALFDSFDADASGSIGFRELNRMLRRDVKNEGPKKETKVAARVQVAEISKLRADCAMAMLPIANQVVKGTEDPFAPVNVFLNDLNLARPPFGGTSAEQPGDRSRKGACSEMKISGRRNSSSATEGEAKP